MTRAQKQQLTHGPGRGSTPLSRIVHQVDRVTSRPATAAVVALLVVAFFVALALAGFPSSWQTAFAAVCAAVTTIMVFTIQHTQSREQAATQLKLDELIRALPGADDHLVHVESGADEELAELEQRHLEHHLSIRADE
jgi:low affinity Fe/Cu permease